MLMSDDNDPMTAVNLSQPGPAPQMRWSNYELFLIENWKPSVLYNNIYTVRVSCNPHQQKCIQIFLNCQDLIFFEDTRGGQVSLSTIKTYIGIHLGQCDL